MKECYYGICASRHVGQGRQSPPGDSDSNDVPVVVLAESSAIPSTVKEKRHDWYADVPMLVINRQNISSR